jgi:hypothetical protein
VLRCSPSKLQLPLYTTFLASSMAEPVEQEASSSALPKDSFPVGSVPHVTYSLLLTAS